MASHREDVFFTGNGEAEPDRESPSSRAATPASEAADPGAADRTPRCKSQGENNFLATLGHLRRMTCEPDRVILDVALKSALEATDSRLGYILLVDRDQNRLTLLAASHEVPDRCASDRPAPVYPIGEAGIWAETLHRRQALIINDYSSLPSQRRIPDTKVPLQRHMSLPVCDDDRVVLLAGVANRRQPYSEAEARQLSLLMENVWNILKCKETEQALQQAREELENYRGIVNSTPDLVALVDHAFVYRTVNDSYLEAFGTTRKDILGRSVAHLLGRSLFESHIQPQLLRAFAGETVRSERWISFPVAGRRLCDLTFHPVRGKEENIPLVATNIRDITDARMAMDDRQRIFSASFDLMCVIGFDGCIKDLNPSWTRALGWNLEDLQGKPWLDLVHPEDRAMVVKREEQLLMGQRSSGAENRLRCKDGRYRWVSWNSSVDRDRQEVFAIARDITDSRMLQDALKSSVRKYRTFFDSAGDGVFVHDYSGRLLDVNRVACERLRYSREELLRMPAEERNRTRTAVSAAQLRKIHREGQASFEARHVDRDGKDLLVWTNSRRIEYDGLPAVLSICRDISERKRMENKLRDLAITDSLTGARNRRYFLDRGKEELSRSLRYETPLCLLLIDADHFKQINDTYGHDAGDEVLKLLTAKARKVLRATDLFARFGGEEFAALLMQTNEQEALLTAERLRAAIAAMPLPMASEDFFVTVSIGVAPFDACIDSIEELIRRADQAMYQAKKAGRNRVVIYRTGNSS